MNVGVNWGGGGDSEVAAWRVILHILELIRGIMYIIKHFNTNIISITVFSKQLFKGQT